jgi:hypothetical protein
MPEETPPPPTFAESQLAAIEAALRENPAARSVTVGGVAVQYEDLVKRRDYWLKKISEERGQRPVLLKVRLS